MTAGPGDAADRPRPSLNHASTCWPSGVVIQTCSISASLGLSAFARSRPAPGKIMLSWLA